MWPNKTLKTAIKPKLDDFEEVGSSRFFNFGEFCCIEPPVSIWCRRARASGLFGLGFDFSIFEFFELFEVIAESDFRFRSFLSFERSFSGFVFDLAFRSRVS